MSDRREQIVRAAIEVFATYGLARTTMTDIARRAGVSRQTLYATFGNRDEVFLAAAQALHDATSTAVQQAAAGDAPPVERLVEMFTAKADAHVELLRTSPHGRELLDENARVGGELSEAADREFRSLVEGVLRDAGVAFRRDLSARAAADVMCDLLAHTEAIAIRTPGSWQRRVDLLVRTAYDGVV